MKSTFGPKSLTLAAIVFILSFGVGASTVSGQGETASPSPSLSLDTEGGSAAHPAHIHTGSCDELGEVVFPLNDVAPLDPQASPAASPTDTESEDPDAAEESALGVSTPTDMDDDATDSDDMEIVVAESSTILTVSLDEILEGDHAVNVHESAENIQNYIACGDITGTATNGHLRVDLEELNDSGFEGRAVLTANPDGTTTVTVTLRQDDGVLTGTPEASPSS